MRDERKFPSIDRYSQIIADKTPSRNAGFNEDANYLWVDKVNFNVLTSEGYLTDEAKSFIKENKLTRRQDQTWADVVFANLPGRMVKKSQKKRSDVRFNGKLIESNILNAIKKDQ